MARTGRPLKYNKKEEIQEIFDRYVSDCIEKKQTLTKAGLLFYLELSRESYREYKMKPEFVDTLRKIEYLIENAWLQRLTETGATGAIFYLKNAFKELYKDRQETDITTNGKDINNQEVILKVNKSIDTFLNERDKRNNK